MEILSSYDISVLKKKGKNKVGEWMNNMFPVQFVTDKEKTLQWASQTMNWIEQQGMLQLRRNVNWMQKNYAIANNILDKRDYIREPENEYFSMINRLTDEGSATELRAIPFVQLIVNTLCNEQDKRPAKMYYTLRDNKSLDEYFASKEEDLEQSLLMGARMKQMNKMLELGLTDDSEQGQQMMSEEGIKSLPEIQDFYTNSYRSRWQNWAQDQADEDDERFYMHEQRRSQFKDYLCTGRVFSELQMLGEDYRQRRLNPPQVFYRKSPGQKWIQNGQWAGHITLMTVPDTLDMFGWMMTDEQQLGLNTYYPAAASSWSTAGQRPEDMWDTNQDYAFNRTGPGIAARQMFSALAFSPGATGDVANQLVATSEDVIDNSWNQLVRVSTIYWKTQRKVFELTKKDAEGNVIIDLVTEDYKVTDKPVYNTLVYKDKSAENLIFGEHLEGIWVNEVWGGIKVGPNFPIYGWTGSQDSFTPMYLGCRGGVPGKMPYQFKKEKEKWNPLLPICGFVANDENTHARAFIDPLKIYQIGVNMTANQMLDLMIDELGVIVALDPTSLPTHSLGEDWGPDPFPKAIQVMRDFSAIPLKRGMTESGQYTAGEAKVLDLTQSQRFVTKMTLHRFFKEEGLSSVGLSPQRMGQQLDKIDTATGIEQAVSSSFSSTEHLFTDFDEYLVRFYQMRTDLAQYYNCTNPSVRLQRTSSTGMQSWFELDGRDLDGRDLGVGLTNSPHTRYVLEQMKQYILKDNTSQTDLMDRLRLIKTDSIADIDPLIKEIQMKQQKDIQYQTDVEQQQQQAEQQHQMQMQQEANAFIAEQNQMDRENKLEVAQIQIAPKVADAGAINDNTEKMGMQQMQHTDKMNMERQKESNRSVIEQQKLDIRQQEIAAENKRTTAMVNAKRTAPVKKDDKTKKK